MSRSVDDRLNEVESRLTYQDQNLQTLSNLVYAQQKQLMQFQNSLELLTRRLQDAGQSEAGSVIDEPPPHY